MDELTAISNEMALMKRQFEKRCGILEARLEQQRKNQFNLERERQSKVFVALAPSETEHGLRDAPLVPPKKMSIAHAKEPAMKVGSALPNKSESSFFNIIWAAFSRFVLPLLAILMTHLLPMLTNWAAPFIAIYERYKSRNMVTTLLLMTLGLSFTVAGFGYLL